MSFYQPLQAKTFKKKRVNQVDYPGNHGSPLETPISYTFGLIGKVGTDQLRWKSLIQQGLDASSNYTRNGVKVDFRDSFIQVDEKDNINRLAWERLSGIIYSPGTLSHLAGDSSLDSRAIVAFLKKARGVQTAFQGGVFLGELRETLHMLRNPAMALRFGLSDYLSFLRKKRRKIPERRKKNFLSQTWLEYAYGWRPLVSDILDAGRALNRDRHLQRQVIPARGFAKEDMISTSVEQSVSTGSSEVRYRRTNYTSRKVMYVGGIYSNADHAAQFTAQNLGFTLDNFVPTVWELIPYSFLVDYFTNIGDCLDAWSFQKSAIAWCCKVVRETTVGRTVGNRFIFAPPPGGWKLVNLTADYGWVQWQLDSIARTVISPDNLVPSLGFKIPGIGSTKWINMAALAAQHKSLIRY
jgi:hypothetical protein